MKKNKNNQKLKQTVACEFLRVALRRLTVVRLLCSDSERVDWVTRVQRAAVAAAVARVRQTIRRLFAVLAQQGVEAVVEVSTEAKVGGIAGAEPRLVVLGPRCRQQTLVLVVVGWLVDEILLEGREQGRTVTVQAS